MKLLSLLAFFIAALSLIYFISFIEGMKVQDLKDQQIINSYVKPYFETEGRVNAAHIKPHLSR